MKSYFMKCPCCGSGEVEVCQRPEPHSVCGGCLHRWKSRSLPGDYYRSLSGRSAMPGKSVERKNRERLGALMPYLRDGMRVLEIGCAEGILGGTIKQNVNLVYHGVEPSRDAETAAVRLDRVWGSVGEIPRTERFDIVLAYHVLEHIPDPSAMTASVSMLLNEEGLFVAEVPDFSGNSRLPWDFNREHLHLFSPASISCLFGRRGFSVRALSTGCYESAVYSDSMRVVAHRKPDVEELERRLKDRFRNLLGERFVVYGAGGDFDALVFPYIDSSAVAAIIDSNRSKAGSTLLGKTIQGREAVGSYKNERLLIASYRYQEEIYGLLRDMGIRDEQITTLEEILDNDEAFGPGPA